MVSAQTSASGTCTVTKAVMNGVTTIPAGDSLDFLINYAYASTTQNGRNITVVDQLDPDLSWAAVDVIPIGTIHVANTAYDPATGSVTFTFVDPLPAGSSGQLGIRVRFPNGRTPNGTVATNTVTMDGDNTNPATSNQVSVSATAAARWLANVTGPSTAQIGANVIYRARLDRPSPAEGNLDVTSGTLALTLPVGVFPADIVNANGGTVTGTGVTGDPVVVTWPTGAVAADGPSGQAVSKSLTIKYSSARFTNGQIVTVAEQMNLVVFGGGAQTGTDTQNTTLSTVAPKPEATALKGTSNAAPQIGQSFYYTLDADSTGNVGLENFTVTDPLPQNFALSSVRLPTVTSGPGGNFIHLTYQRSDTGSTEHTWPGSPFAAGTTTLPVSALGLPGGVHVSHVRFGMGSVASGFKISTPIRLNGTLLTTGWGSPARIIASGSQIDNTMTLSADYNSTPAVEKPSTIPVNAYTPQLIPSSWKYRLSTIPNNVAPDAEVTWYVEVENNSASDYPMVNGMGIDLLPPELEYVPGSFAEVTDANFDPANPTYNNANAPVPTLLDVTPNFNGTGRTRIRWSYNHTFPVGTWATILFKTTFKSGATVGTFINDSLTSVNEAAQAGPVSYRNSVADSIDLDADGSTTDNIAWGNAQVGIGSVNPEAWKYKHSATPATLSPGQTVRWYAEVGNQSAATFPMVNGMGIDLLPPELEYVPGSFAEVTDANFDPANPTHNPAGAPAPVLLGVFPNYNGTGRTLLRWSYTHNFLPGTWATVTFLTRVKPGTLAGNFDNKSNVAVDEAAQPGPVLYQLSTTDPYDIDGDGITTDGLSEYTSPFKVGSSASLDSVKWVKGGLDTDWSKFPDSGSTTPGGAADYRLVVFNSGNVALRDISITDILPIVGDTGVVATQPRYTQWTPFLAGPVTAPDGVTVYYSTQSNPQRDDMGDPDPYPAGAQPPNWSAVPPSDITTVRSLRFDFGAIVLGAGDQLELRWAMRAPVDAPTGGEIAWNSFGVVATRDDNGLALLPTEPFKVGIKVEPIHPAAYGDLVWNDLDRDGIKDAGEAGLDGVRVELYHDNGDRITDPATDDLVAFTLSSGGGRYVFPNLAAGSYYAVFFKPPVLSVSPANQGGDDGVDSDGSAATVRGLPATITQITTLLPEAIDLTWDQGFFLPEVATTAVGNYVWHDEDGDGMQNEPAAEGINGVTVKLYKLGGTLVDTRTTANDMNGNPGYYLFDGLQIYSYYLEFVLPPGSTFSPRDQGTNDEADSDPDPANGRTSIFTLVPGQYDSTRDAAIFLPTGSMSLGNQLWLDTNQNGIYEPGSGETGVDGVRMNLYRDSDGNGVFTAEVDQFFDTTFTVTRAGVAGRYLFENLPIGNYIVQVAPENFTGGAPLQGTISTSGNSPAPDPDNDADHDDNGDAMAGQGVVSRAVTLTLAGEPVNDGDTSNNSNLTLDFGFVPPHDFGDLADTAAGTGTGNYETLLANNGPRHMIVGGFNIGADMDAESNGQPDNGATGDGPDEDGVASFPTFVAGGSGTIAVGITNPSGDTGAGTLYGFIDWNNDGDFGDTNEAAAVAVADGATSVHLPYTVPADAVAGTNLGLRLRLTTDTLVLGHAGSLGAASNGEVEDYVITVNPATPAACKLYVSDFITGGYTTSDRIHRFEPSTGALLNTYPSPLGGAVWDLDAYNGVLYSGVADQGVVTKFDLDGHYLGAHLPLGATYAAYGSNPGGTLASAPSFDFDATGRIYVACGYSSVVRFDLNGANGINLIHVGWGLRGVLVDDATGDVYVMHDAGSGLGGAGGIARFNSVGVLQDRNDLSTNFTGGSGNWSPGSGFGMAMHNGKLYLVHGSGPWDVKGVWEVDYRKIGGGGTHTAVMNTDYRMFAQAANMGDPRDLEFSPDDGNLYVANHAATNSEVYRFHGTTGASLGTLPSTPNDMQFKGLAFACEGSPQYDFGDLADTAAGTGAGNYETRLANNGPLHMIVGGFNIGATIDAETDGQPDSGATGDGSDEDGVASFPVFGQGTSGTIPVSVTNPTGGTGAGTLYGFIDWNSDGDFGDTNEATSVAVADGATSVNLPYTVPATAVTGTNLGFRIRLTTDTLTLGQPGAIGAATNGEVEDYMVQATGSGSLGNLVFADKNNDGLFNGSDTGIDGVTVVLDRDINGDGDFNDAGETNYATAVTSGGGLYDFANLPAGNYQVRIPTPSATYPISSTTTVTTDNQVNNDDNGTQSGGSGTATVSPVIAIGSGESDPTLDFGFYATASIGDFVWVDANADGSQSGETGLNGVTVELLNSGGSVVASTTTANNPVGGAPGYYLFDNLVPGIYSVRFVKPSGYVFTTQSGAITGTTNSDANTGTGQTPQVTLASGDAVRYVDAGVYQLASLGDSVWSDTNKDGIQNDGASSGVNGVTVELLDGSNAVIATTTTASDGSGNPGRYGFANLTPGTYSVRFTAPDGKVFTWQSGAPSVTDNSDADRATGQSAQVVLTAGQNATWLDAGLKCPDTWADWKQLRPGEDAAENLDGDAYDNFAEYAFAMPDNGTGSPHLDHTAWIIQPSTVAPGTLEAVFVRPTGWNTANGQGAVTYRLQYAATIGNPTVWQEIVLTPAMYSVVDNGDCTETVTLADLENLTGLGGGTGVVRIEAEQSDGTGPDSGATSYSEPEGWTETPLERCCQTYNTPYQRETVFTGTVSSVSGQDLAFSGQDLSGLLQPGISYYLEVLGGDNEGQRFDVTATTGTTVTLAGDSNILSAAPPFNTLTTVPASLAGDVIAIRPHWTLGGMFPEGAFVAGSSNATADQVQTYAGGAFTTYWLYDLGDSNPATARWVRTGDGTMADQAGTVIPPGQGMFFTKRVAAAAILSYGEVRTNDFIRPLATGAQSNLVGGGYPVDQAPVAGRELGTADGFLGTRDFKTADSIFVWQNDAAPPFNSGYDTYWLLHNVSPAVNQWVRQGDATLAPHDATILFEYDRAVFLRTAADQTTTQAQARRM